MQITIINTAIRQDEHGRYSLNDLHRAAMAAAGRSGNPNDDHQRPGRFFESAGVQDFVAALNAENPAVSPVASVPGRKGGEYRVLGVVRHSESLEPMVLYRSLGSDGGDWVRPFGMFFETVEHEGESVPRFALLDDGPARPCRTCGPEGCNDSTSCPREGGAA